MTVEPAVFIGTHAYSYRRGEPAEILRVVIVTPDGLAPRACYHVRFSDGVEDYTPISDHAHFEIQPRPESVAV